jgi:hypothetical protein
VTDRAPSPHSPTKGELPGPAAIRLLRTVYYGVPKNSCKIQPMSFLYDKRTKKAIKWIWAVVALLIILSMIFAYSGGVGAV